MELRALFLAALVLCKCGSGFSVYWSRLGVVIPSRSRFSASFCRGGEKRSNEITSTRGKQTRPKSLKALVRSFRGLLCFGAVSSRSSVSIHCLLSRRRSGTDCQTGIGFTIETDGLKVIPLLFFPLASCLVSITYLEVVIQQQDSLEKHPA